MESERENDPSATTAPGAAPPPAAESAAPPRTPADAAAQEELVRHKRPRAALDPSTPKGDEDESKRLSGSTPVAKKGRVEGDEDIVSDNDRATSPPPAAAAASSRPTTPTNTSSSVVPPATEGKDTKQLRERVQALKPPGQTAENEGEAHDADVEIAEVADEVAASAAKLGDEQDKKEEKDVEIAEVAAEVGKSAQNLAKEDERDMQDVEDGVGEGVSKAKADVAAEVGESAAKVQAQDERIADDASEVAEAAVAAPEETPKPSTAVAPFEPKPQSTFASYSSTASPFSAFASSASPLSSLSTPTKPAAEAQKPKAKSAFTASPFLSTTAPPATPSASSSTATSTSKASDLKADVKPAGERPTTPFTKSAATTNLAAASPFSAFSASSGFASATKSSGASAFSAFSAAPSAFSSVPPTPAKPSAAGGEAADASSSADAGGASAGAPNDADAPERVVYTKQETVTGEEEERLLHSVRCKLYAMNEGQWAERGTGNLKLNETNKDDGNKGARLLMRADATHRLLLNAPLFKAFSIEVHSEKYVRFSVIEGSTPTSYMLRLGNPAAASTLVQAVQDKVATL
ncbi:uncharacterized protein RHOBADRAFT_50967 [Rhodotorula graminis WP1]|uniref:RanBD1 domain-containing protein n=1 Tax=Rhodotorula graminis (strain WP1) TaxID=578459 RepID=A0A194SCP8_RHOGW|nr:uncharacterized protein RHOBADRAFT_50967 [Rhodotorula graminis WP1]KPV78508.1 hypothetical protein RHOBADRAFT_50967 [Rhodotorula graminis WP1]